MSGNEHHDAESILERRKELLPSRGRNDPELAELTAALSEVFSTGTGVRRLQLGLTLADDALGAHLLASEPVNPPRSNHDGQRRFAEDRRVVLFVHPGLPDRPLAVVWIALCSGCPGSLDEILDPEAPVLDPTTADTAVFYSIWTIEEGLSGLGVAGALITEAADGLGKELPGLSTLTTMSPIPGFREWYEAQPPGEIDPTSVDAHLRACACYLVGRDDTDQTDGFRPRDAVARFHMGNGARLWRLLPDADRSTLGVERAFAVMVNYRYAPEDLAANKAALDRGNPAMGGQVVELLSSGPTPQG